MGDLRCIKLHAITFSANLRASDRGNLLEQFNDVNCNVHSLVVPWTMTLSGLNMHRDCNWGIMVSLYESAAKTRQILARIYRIGSQRTVRWFIVVQTASFARVQERSCHTKLVESLSITGQLPLEITGDLRAIMCYEVAREQFGAVESKYTVSRHSKDIKSVRDYEGVWVKRYAAFFSWLASLAFEKIKQTGDDVDSFARVLDLIDRMKDLDPVFRAACLIIQMTYDSDDSTDTWLRRPSWKDVDMIRSRNKKDQEKHSLDIMGLEDQYYEKLKARRGGEAARLLRFSSISFTHPLVPQVVDPEPSFEGFKQTDGEQEQRF